MLWQPSVRRRCPECYRGMLDVSRLYRGVNCPNCRSLVVVNDHFSFGIPISLAIILTIAFEYDYNQIGLTAIVLIVVFTAGYKSVFSKYLPLKHYDDD